MNTKVDNDIRILLLEDELTDAELAEWEIRRELKQCDLRRVDTRESFLQALATFAPHVIVSDYNLPRFDGLTALRLAQERAPLTPLIILTGSLNEDTAVDCMKAGAANYVIKERMKRLGQTVVHALEEGRLRCERRRLEEQLRQAQKMEAVGQLASGLAHDFNNVLTTIMGNASLLGQDETLDAMHASEVREIMDAAGRASQLTRQLLLFSRKQTLQPVNMDLNDAVAQMLKLLRRVLGENISIQMNFAPELPLVRGDAGMIDQVLLNLAVNARDAMPQGGTLTFRTTVRQLETDEPGPAPARVGLTVSDTGCGIHPDHLPHIFEPFFTTKAAGKGTGLGLATAYGIIQQHGGTIEVSSRLGQGTRFHLELPAAEDQSVAAPEPAAAAPISGGNEVLLLVEDELSVRLMTSRLLQRSGYVVLQAESGPEAVQVWTQHRGRIQLLLTDMIMPGGMTGRGLAARLRSEAPGLRVVYSSGYNAELAGHSLAPAPGTRFLQKPYAFAELARAVRDCLNDPL